VADNVRSHEPSRAALLGSFLVGAAVGAAGVSLQPLVVIALTAALMVGGDVVASRAPDAAVPRAVHFARATAAGLGVVAIAFVLLQVLDY
jgi:hypothetical protein